jgi:putative hemolysin
VDFLIIFGLILLNGVFSMSELAGVSSRRIRLEKLAHGGSHGARAALRLAEQPSQFLSTVQVGITLIGIFNGAFGEASIVERLTPSLARFAPLADYAREIALGIVVFCITFASIVFGELIPKRIAMQYPEGVATLIAAPLQLLSRLMGPFVTVLSATTEFFLRLVGLHRRRESGVTEAEITEVLKEGAEAGMLEKTEHDIARRAIRLDDVRVAALMTPRGDLQFIDLDDPVERNLSKIAQCAYTRFPVYQGDRSQIIGIVHSGDLFEQVIKAGSLGAVDIGAVTKPALYVPDTASAMDLLEDLKKNRAEIALVVNEYGDIEGLVTLSDVMGSLVGDVATINDEDSADAVQREDGSWLIDAGLSFDRFRDVFHTDIRFPDEQGGAYHTIAGFVLSQLGRIPKTSDQFAWEGYRVEVVDMDGHRIDRLRVSVVPPENRPDATGAAD